jgi:putative ABC transport system permease protein
MAIRAALGAGRSRLITQLLTESVLLALAGGMAGVVFAFWAIRLLLTLTPIDVPRLRDAAVDWHVLVFCLAAGMLTGILSGLAPAWSGSRAKFGLNLKEGARTASVSRRRHSLQELLVVFELALALVLLSGAGLALKSLWGIRSGTSASAPESVLVTAINSRQLGGGHHAERYIDNLVAQIQAIPGVLAAGASGCGAVPLKIAGLPDPPSGRGANLTLPCVSGRYPAALGLRLLSGRWFDDRDRDGSAPVAVVNEATERACLELFPGSGSIIGKRLDTGGPSREFPTIIGVVSDFRWRPDTDAELAAFVPSVQVPFRGLATVLVRASSDPMPLASTIHRLVSQTPGVSMTRAETLRDRLSAAIAPRQLQVCLLVVFAGLALLLAIVGTYGVLAYSVAQRTHEIGVRMALGADAHDVLINVVGRAAKLIFAGVALGCAGSASLARFMGSMLYGVPKTDVTTFASVSVLLIAVALLAAYVPTCRALRVDPALALRRE